MSLALFPVYSFEIEMMNLGRKISILARGASVAFAFSVLVAQSEEEGRKPNRPTTDYWAGKTIKDGPHVIGMLNSRLHNAPKEGEISPVTIVNDAKTGQSISLASLYPKKPLVLFFASYSCACSQKAAGFMADLNTKYGDQFQFLLIYIREAHPKGEFSPGPAGEKFVVPDPQNLRERAAMALRFAREQKIEFPVFVDSMNDTQAVQWGAWPARLFVINTAGEVVYAGEQGPWFVKPTETFDLGFHGVPKQYGNLPGYSWGNLEDFLKKNSED